MDLATHDSKPFDFASLDGFMQAQEDGREIAVTLPDGRETGLRITVAGPDSKRVRKAVWWGRDEGGAQRIITDERREEIERQVTARCCTGWTGATLNGADVPFSIEEAAMWFARLPFIERQVSAATGDRARFMST